MILQGKRVVIFGALDEQSIYLARRRKMLRKVRA